MEPRVAPETEESLIVEHRRECMLRRAVRREFQQDLFALEGDASWEGPCRDGPSAASGTPGVSSSVVVMAALRHAAAAAAAAAAAPARGSGGSYEPLPHARRWVPPAGAVTLEAVGLGRGGCCCDGHKR
jgi:hypothetical protein